VTAVQSVPSVKSLLDSVVFRPPVRFTLPDLFAEGISLPPMTTANRVTCVVELRPGAFSGTSEVKFDVKAFRCLPGVPLEKAPYLTKTLKMSRTGDLKAISFEFSPKIADDGRFAYLVQVDSKSEVAEAFEGETGPNPGSYTAGNIIIVYGPNW
jgi:hypothetical protein